MGKCAKSAQSRAKATPLAGAASGRGFKLLPPERGNLLAEKHAPKTSLSENAAQLHGGMPGKSRSVWYMGCMCSLVMTRSSTRRLAEG